MPASFAAELRREPAILMWGANAAAALWAAFGFHPSAHVEAVVVTIATALVAFTTAIVTRPHSVSAASGAVAAVTAAAAAFGLHLPPGLTGTLVAAGSLLVSLLHRQAVSPVTFARTPVPGGHPADQ